MLRQPVLLFISVRYLCPSCSHEQPQPLLQVRNQQVLAQFVTLMRRERCQPTNFRGVPRLSFAPTQIKNVQSNPHHLLRSSTALFPHHDHHIVPIHILILTQDSHQQATPQVKCRAFHPAMPMSHNHQEHTHLHLVRQQVEHPRPQAFPVCWTKSGINHEWSVIQYTFSFHDYVRTLLSL